MSDTNPKYLIADHIRAASFIIASGVKPSGKQRGYVLRRLIRRSLAASIQSQIDISQKDYFKDLVEAVEGIYLDSYPEISENKDIIIETIYTEAQKYQKAIKTGEKEWEKYFQKSDEHTTTKTAQKIWNLYQTHGVPIELSEQILQNKLQEFDKKILEELVTKHQLLSQSTSKGQFKSGLGENTEQTKKLHTATHILHQTLRNMLSQNVKQMGSAITSQKARFDFTLDRKLSEDELQELERKVQETIDKNLQMVFTETDPDTARQMGAIGLFGEKYNDTVRVYTLEDKEGVVYSREFCTGPHVDNTSEIGKFKILKHKSIGQGLKRVEYSLS